jgi:hypothetical protein
LKNGKRRWMRKERIGINGKRPLSRLGRFQTCSEGSYIEGETMSNFANSCLFIACIHNAAVIAHVPLAICALTMIEVGCFGNSRNDRVPELMQ